MLRVCLHGRVHSSKLASNIDTTALNKHNIAQIHAVVDLVQMLI